jgi:response regulator RpfG family c-di-GMP phosphodiesterase
MNDTETPFEALLDPFAASLACGVLIVDAEERILVANAAFALMARRSTEALVGQSATRLFHSPAGVLAELLAHSDDASRSAALLDRGDVDPLPVVLHRGAQLANDARCRRVMLVVDISALMTSVARREDQLAVVSRLSDTVIEQALELKRHAERLEQRVRERTAELREANLDAIFMLAVASEAKDADTGAHVLRIQRGCEDIAVELGMDATTAEEIGYSAILHDVGKMIVPDHILQKPGKLTDDERRTMQQHTIAGERILSTKPFFVIARQIARQHHENWDGSGYPDGLAGEDIALPARIVHVADVFDALVSTRVYKPPWAIEKAWAFIQEQSGAMFDPRVVGALGMKLAR